MAEWKTPKINWGVEPLGATDLNRIESNIGILQTEIAQDLFPIPGWRTPKTDWKGADNGYEYGEQDVVGASDLNRIEGNIKALKDRIDAGLFAYVVPSDDVIISSLEGKKVTASVETIAKEFEVKYVGTYRITFHAWQETQANNYPQGGSVRTSTGSRVNFSIPADHTYPGSHTLKTIEITTRLPGERIGIYATGRYGPVWIRDAQVRGTPVVVNPKDRVIVS